MTARTDQVLERALTIARTALRFGEVKRVTRHDKPSASTLPAGAPA